MGILKIAQKWQGVRKTEKRQIAPKKNQKDLPEQKQHTSKGSYKNSFIKFFKNY